jgi:hypothetical protein
MPGRLLAVCLVGILLIACRPDEDGILGSADLESLPDMKCVGEVLSKQSMDGTLYFSDYRGIDLPKWTGLQPKARIPTYSYSDGKVRYVFGFVVEDRKPIQYAQKGTTTETASPELLRAIRENLREVSTAIGDRCNVPGLPGRIIESCWGRNCPRT